MGDAVRAVFHARYVAGAVMDKPAGYPLAEACILLRVEDEGVPADVHQRRRAVATLRIMRAERQEGECLVHDALGEHTLGLVAPEIVLDDSVNKTIPKQIVDEVLVGQLGTYGHFINGSGHSHILPSDELERLL